MFNNLEWLRNTKCTSLEDCHKSHPCKRTFHSLVPTCGSCFYRILCKDDCLRVNIGYSFGINRRVGTGPYRLRICIRCTRIFINQGSVFCQNFRTLCMFFRLGCSRYSQKWILSIRYIQWNLAKMMFCIGTCLQRVQCQNFLHLYKECNSLNLSSWYSPKIHYT